jgi:hypothetical protein
MARTKSKSNTNNKNLNPTKSTPLLTAGFRKAPGAKIKIRYKKLTVQVKEKMTETSPARGLQLRRHRNKIGPSPFIGTMGDSAAQKKDRKPGPGLKLTR